MLAAASWGKFTPARKIDIIQELYRSNETSAVDLSKRIAEKYGIEVSKNAIIGFYGRNPALRDTHPLTGIGGNAGPYSGAKSEYARQVAQEARAARERLAAQRRAEKEERRRQDIERAEKHEQTKRIAERREEISEFAKTGSLNVDIFALTDSTCRWPTANDARAMTYCGRDDIKKGRHYCYYHDRLAYSPKSS